MTRLRVLVDARRLQDSHPGGAKRVLEELVPRLANDPALEIRLLYDGRHRAPELNVDAQALSLSRLPTRLPELAWLELAVAPYVNRARALFHGTFYLLPLRLRSPAVVSMYDISWETHPEDFSAAKRQIWRVYGRRTARRAAAIITSSQFTAQNIIRRYGTPQTKLNVTPLSVPTGFVSEDARLSLPDGTPARYVLALGGAPRRGLAVSIGAWRRVRSMFPDVDLVVVGREPPPAAPGIVYAGPVDDAAWAALLARADAFIYGTRHEGYGLPALEAIAAGAPVVCAAIGSLPEVLRDAAAWCDTPTVADLADALIPVLMDSTRRDALVRAGLAQAARHPTWDDAAEATADVYRRAALLAGS